jgi:hypothetical protein
MTVTVILVLAGRRGVKVREGKAVGLLADHFFTGM